MSTSTSTSRPTRAPETANPSVRSASPTASPCGSRMPSFGRISTVAFTGPPSGRRDSVERDLRQPLERFDVAGARPGDDILRHLGPGVGAIPSGREAEVAHVLLVERRLRPARAVRVGRPEARRVGRQRLVAERDDAVSVDAELELRVGEDDPARLGMRRCEGVEPERCLPRRGVGVGPAQLGGIVLGDVEVVPLLGLRRRRHDRRRQAVRLAQPRRQRVAADRPGRPVVDPARARRGSRARRTRPAASRAAGRPSSGRRRRARAGGSARSRSCGRTRTRTCP